MKSTIIDILLVILAFTLLILTVTMPVKAAGNFKLKKVNSQPFFTVRFTDNVSEYIDTETGVHYLVVFDNDSMNAICPRYNKDGNIMIDKER